MLPRFDKEQTGFGALYRLYATQSGWIQVAAVEPSQWPTFCQAINRGDLTDDARFATAADRAANRAALEAEVVPILATATALQWRRPVRRRRRAERDLCRHMRDGETHLFDQELLDLGVIASNHHPDHGQLRQVGQCITFSDTPGRVERAPWTAGQHTVEIMRELGYDDENIARLDKDGVIAVPEGALG